MFTKEQEKQLEELLDEDYNNSPPETEYVVNGEKIVIVNWDPDCPF